MLQEVQMIGTVFKTHTPSGFGKRWIPRETWGNDRPQKQPTLVDVPALVRIIQKNKTTSEGEQECVGRGEWDGEVGVGGDCYICLP